MTDLLIRLREGSSHLAHDATMHEAAAEIERLRAALAAEQPEPGGWLEAAIAWEVCASIHETWAKGKDALYRTRHADLVKHADDARKKHAAEPAPQPEPLTDEQIDAGVAAWFATTTSNSEDREHPFRQRMRAAIERAIRETKP